MSSRPIDRNMIHDTIHGAMVALDVSSLANHV